MKRRIKIKTEKQIDEMLPACQLAFELLNEVEKIIEPGISTEEIDKFVSSYTKDKGAISAPLNYHGFPKSVCTSVNEVVCHGIPSPKKILKKGDIINVDVTPILNGYYGDSSRTFFVGEVSEEAKKLVQATEESMYKGISAVRDGGNVGDIGAAIQKFVEPLGYSVVRDFVGHGIGTEFHEEPQIPHYGKKGKGTKLSKGMVFTIEPMINLGGYETKILADEWTAITVDRSLSAQFEHTLAIRHNGKVDILTGPR